jgi:hypothetical protein
VGDLESVDQAVTHERNVRKRTQNQSTEHLQTGHVSAQNTLMHNRVLLGLLVCEYISDALLLCESAYCTE